MQLRLRFCQPRPQLALQTDHSVHVDHPPFTGRTEKDWGQGAGASSDMLAQGPGQGAGGEALEGRPHCANCPFLPPAGAVGTRAASLNL